MARMIDQRSSIRHIHLAGLGNAYCYADQGPSGMIVVMTMYTQLRLPREMSAIRIPRTQALRDHIAAQFTQVNIRQMSSSRNCLKTYILEMRRPSSRTVEIPNKTQLKIKSALPVLVSLGNWSSGGRGGSSMFSAMAVMRATVPYSHR